MQTVPITIGATEDEVLVRDASRADVESCARIFYEAFASLATRHSFPVEPGSPEFTRFKVGEMLASDGFDGLVAERGGVVLGSAFVDHRAVIAGGSTSPGSGFGRPTTRICLPATRSVGGHERSDELRHAIAAGTARVVEHPDGISGYATGFGYGWHAVAETNRDLIALLGSAEAFVGLGIIVPSRNAELLSWCLTRGLKIVQQSTLMTTGLYNEPSGAYLPPILY